MKTKQYFLVLAFALTAVVVALSGLSPEWFAWTFLGLAELDVNMVHVLRAMAAMYLALGLFWLFAAFREAHRNTAVLTTVFISAGLVIGGNASIFLDGQPAPIMLVYTGMGLAIVPIAYWIYRLPE